MLAKKQRSVVQMKAIKKDDVFARKQGADPVKGSGLRVGCRVNLAHVRQSRPDSGFSCQVKALDTVYVIPSSLGSGR